MARIGGRNSFMAWVVGLGCAAVVVVLLALAIPAIPTGIQMVGDTLRAATSAPAAVDETVAPAPPTTTPLCREIYTDALWGELTQRVGGDPVQDAAAPLVSAASLSTALAPQVRATCTFTAINTGSIVTTVSDVATGSTDVAEAALETAGYSCAGYGDGIRCSLRTTEGSEEQVVRGGVWLATTFRGWVPDHYTERIAQQLWPR